MKKFLLSLAMLMAMGTSVYAKDWDKECYDKCMKEKQYFSKARHISSNEEPSYNRANHSKGSFGYIRNHKKQKRVCKKRCY